MVQSVTNSEKKKKKLAWSSYRARAAVDQVLRYSETKIKQMDNCTTHNTISNKFENRRAKNNLSPAGFTKQ